MNGCEEPILVGGVRRAIYIALAAVFFAVGMIGVVLPGLPTTPFLLLMSYFLIRSSPRLHRQAMRVPVVGRLLRDWRERRGVRLQVKVVACLMVAAVVALSLSSTDLGLWLKVAIALLASCGIWIVLRLPTVAAGKPATEESQLVSLASRQIDNRASERPSRATLMLGSAGGSPSREIVSR